MAFVAAPLVVGGVAAARWMMSSSKTAAESDADVDAQQDTAKENGEVAESSKGTATTETWKEYSGRDDGREGYVFGDISRGITRRVFGGADAVEESDEKHGDEKFSQVQRLVRDAVVAYKSRGYGGTITISQRVGLFTESCSIGVTAAKTLAPPTDEAEVHSVSGDIPRVFATLFSRLERRAANWEALSGVEGLDPTLATSATIGFALPVIKVGWGISVSFSVNKSSLLRWAMRRSAPIHLSDGQTANGEDGQDDEDTRKAAAVAADAAVAAAADDDL